MSFLTTTKERNKGGGLTYMPQQGGSVDLFAKAGSIVKPQTNTSHTTANEVNIAPGTIGSEISHQMNTQPKNVISQLSRQFPVNGMEPEDLAKLNVAAKLSGRVAHDAKVFTGAAKTIAGNMAEVYEAQGEHKQNMMQADLKTKRTDVKYLGNTQEWQTETLSLVEKARYHFAGIQLAKNCL
jgi:hypothetical protein